MGNYTEGEVMRFRIMVLHYTLRCGGVDAPSEWVYRIGGFAESLKEAKEIIARRYAGEPCYVERRFGSDKWIGVAHSTHA